MINWKTWKMRKWALAVGIAVIAVTSISNDSIFGIGVAIAFGSFLVDE